MLRRFEIENYGLIAGAAIELAAGATIFTGETGSGKTMVLGALGFALGERAAADAVRRGASKAVVTLGFDPDDALRARLAADGFELDAGEEATIVREMSDAGRSTVRLCGRPSTAGYLREIGAAVAEIVGQHEAQALLSPPRHVAMLDRFAGESALRARERVAEAYERAGAATRALDELRGEERRARERYDDACFAVREIEEARPETGEDERLLQRRRYLDNVERIAAALGRAHAALENDDAGALETLGAAASALAGVADIGDDLRGLAERAAALQSEANDLAAGLARALESTDFDPNELETVNARLETLERIKRKYGGSLEAAAAFAAQARETVAAFEGRDRRAAELSAAVAAAGRALGAAAMELSAARKTAAAALARAVTGEFADLALGQGRFDVLFEPLERIGPEGAERVEFLFAANAGEPLRPLGRIASGGELSRVLLALVVSLAQTRENDATLVFDEIDAGIGGITASAVGARIGRLAQAGQVVCVTHLAQLATWADRHYVLVKEEAGGETTIGVREIATPQQREEELARMLSGEAHDAALRHARALLEARPSARR